MFDKSESAGRTELPLVLNTPGWAFWLDGDCDGMVNVMEIKSARRDSFNRSVLVQKDARLLRDLRIIAYFRQCFPSDKPITTIKELAYALASHSPYEVPISVIKIRHLHYQVPSTETYYRLNVTIVGLAVSSEESEDLPWCVGLGIVRGIDTLKGVLYVITPVPPSTLEKVNLFLQGFIQIPTCFLQVKGCRSPYVTSNVLSDRFY
ncbi:Polynucleotide 5'-hydroxyl-kinase NOL9 [Hibiscus syriacus]|uniref:Polynucleotide 5'-hydroxyl-kinase NOL9 n=1 Tax=Hibiscus syriacus TaxID=106335 RepID=A0A6A2Y158_HIBSY|nr:Polynucleotide 5'-hydroxyl-kinase NOL9 [Hibiscus syriacus]